METPETTPTPPVELVPPVKSALPSAPPPDAGPEDKTVAILSYCTLLGFIVALILHQQKKTKLGAYHLRQALGFVIVGIVAWIGVVIASFIVGFILALVINVLAVIVVWLIYIAFIGGSLALWIMGLIAAIKGEMKPMPFVGPLAQKWLGNVFD